MEVNTSCIATTALIKKGFGKIRISKGTLEDQAKKLNEEWHIPITLDHNPLLMPIGRTDSAWIEKSEDDYRLMTKVLLELNAESKEHKKSSTQIAHLKFGESRGFVKAKENENTARIEIQITPSDFEDPEHWKMCQQQISGDSETFRVTGHEQFSEESIGLIRMVISDPQLIGLASVATWLMFRVEKFARYTVDKTLREVGEGISKKWGERILGALKIYEGTKSQTKKKYLWVIVVEGIPDLILVSEREAGKSGILAQELNVDEIFNELSRYEDLLQDAQEIALVKPKQGNWKFQHIKTKSGEIIGDWECYQGAIKRYMEIGREVKIKEEKSK